MPRPHRLPGRPAGVARVTRDVSGSHQSRIHSYQQRRCPVKNRKFGFWLGPALGVTGLIIGLNMSTSVQGGAYAGLLVGGMGAIWGITFAAIRQHRAEFNGRQLAVGADHRIKVVRYAYSAAQSLRSLRGAVEQLVRRAPAEGRPRHRPQFHLSHSVRVSMASRHRPSNASHRLGIRNVIAGGAARPTAVGRCVG